MNNQKSALERAEIGMPVYDKYKQNIGQVIRIRIKDRQIEENASPRNTLLDNNDSEWLSLIADIIEPDDMRGIDLAKELWNEGYIKLGKTSLHGFRKYILPTEIEKINEEGIHLNVARELF